MSAFRPWLVRKSRFPLALPGELLGTVEAHDHDHADSLAAAQFPRPFTIEPAPRVPVSAEAEAKLEKMAARRAQAIGRRPAMRDRYARGDDR